MKRPRAPELERVPELAPLQPVQIPATPAAGSDPKFRLDTHPLSGLAMSHRDPMRGLRTPDCMSSPVSHLRDLTRDMQEEAKRRHAVRYLRESREAHLQQRRLYLVLDLDETLVHSLRSSVRQINEPLPAQHDAAAGPAAASSRSGDGGSGDGAGASSGAGASGAGAGAGGGDDEGAQAEEDVRWDSEDSGEEWAEDGQATRAATAAQVMRGPHGGPMLGATSPLVGTTQEGGDAITGGGIGPSLGPGVRPLGTACTRAPDAEHGRVTLTVQSLQFEMVLRPGVHAFLREMSELFCVFLYTMGSRDYVQQALHHLDPQHEIFRPGQARGESPPRVSHTARRAV